MSASHHDELHQEDYISDKLWEGIGGRGGGMMITAIEPSPTESANSSTLPSHDLSLWCLIYAVFPGKRTLNTKFTLTPVSEKAINVILWCISENFPSKKN